MQQVSLNTVLLYSATHNVILLWTKLFLFLYIVLSLPNRSKQKNHTFDKISTIYAKAKPTMIKSVLKLFGTENDRIVKNYLKQVKKINALESDYEAMDDEALQGAFNALKSDVQEGTKTLDDVLYDSFAITRETAKRVLGMRHYDVQMVGGLVLNDDNIAEMKTGEGKTLVATLAVVLNAMTGKGVHVVTVNDYLAKRDSEEMGVLYEFLGYTVGCLTDEINDLTKLEEGKIILKKEVVKIGSYLRMLTTMFEGTAEDLKETNVTQPAIFLHSVILAKTLVIKLNRLV